MKKIQNIHPGEVLKKEFLKPLNITAYRLCMDINVPQTRISEIIKGNRSITADTAKPYYFSTIIFCCSTIKSNESSASFFPFTIASHGSCPRFTSGYNLYAAPVDV